MIDTHHGWNKSYKPVIIGFVLSIICILGAYYVVAENILRPWLFLAVVAFLGFLQILFQFIFFFHIGIESKPRWNLLMLLFMALVVFLIIGGSIWIMNNLNSYMMPTG